MSHFKYEKPSAVEISEKELDEIAAALSSVGGSTSATFVDCIYQATGFTSNMLGGTTEVYSNLIDSAFGGASSSTAAWAFFRVIGAFSYNGSLQEDVPWNSVAGPLSYSVIGSSDVIPKQEEDFFLNTLGMTKQRYREFRFYVRLQHELCNQSSISEALLNNSKEKYHRYFDEIKKLSHPNGSGKKITDNNYKSFLEFCRKRMYGKCDFSHMCIAIATRLVTSSGFSPDAANLIIENVYASLCAHIEPDTARGDLASWLGDAVLIDPGDAKTSMGDSDFIADVDAVLIADYCSENSYRNAVVKYYNMLGYATRRELFLGRYAALDECVTRMRLASDNGATMTNQQWLSSISTATKYVDTYRFYRILKGEISEPAA